MGMVFSRVVFDGQAPTLATIAEKITERTGLPLVVTESGADTKSELYDLHGYVAFACSPKSRIEVFAYRAGAVNHSLTQNFNETGASQAIDLRGFLGQEPTLWYSTELALEALGGRPRSPIPKEVRRTYGGQINASTIRKNERKLASQGLLAIVLVVLMLPLIIPMWICWFVVGVPWYAAKALAMSRRRPTNSERSA